jgi:hypothetical protein
MSEETNAALIKAAKLVTKSKDLKKFLDFLEAFKADENSHIQSCFTEEKSDIRAAALCAEAHATANLMVRMITPEISEK